jgi:hypothetical protein
MHNVIDTKCESISGMSQAEVFDEVAKPLASATATNIAVRTSQIVWGVFWGMWLFAASYGVLYYMWSNYMRHGNVLY